jgi:hypothetical protein
MVDNWLIDAYYELSRRDKTISDEEVQEIGTRSSIQIFRAREKWLDSGRYVKYSLELAMLSYDHRDFIQKMFRDELEELMRRGIMTYREDFAWGLDKRDKLAASLNNGWASKPLTEVTAGVGLFEFTVFSPYYSSHMSFPGQS